VYGNFIIANMFMVTLARFIVISENTLFINDKSQPVFVEMRTSSNGLRDFPYLHVNERFFV